MVKPPNAGCPFGNRILNIKPVIMNTLKQGSQARGPREGPMWPANFRKNKIYFFANTLFLLQNSKTFFSLFQCDPRDLPLSLMRPASHFEFEIPALKQPL